MDPTECASIGVRPESDTAGARAGGVDGGLRVGIFRVARGAYAALPRHLGERCSGVHALRVGQHARRVFAVPHVDLCGESRGQGYGEAIRPPERKQTLGRLQCGKQAVDFCCEVNGDMLLGHSSVMRPIFAAGEVR